VSAGVRTQGVGSIIGRARDAVKKAEDAVKGQPTPPSRPEPAPQPQSAQRGTPPPNSVSGSATPLRPYRSSLDGKIYTVRWSDLPAPATSAFFMFLENSQQVMLTRNSPDQPFVGASGALLPSCGTRIETMQVAADLIRLRIACGNLASAPNWKEFELTPSSAAAAPAATEADVRALAAKESSGATEACKGHAYLPNLYDCACWGQKLFDARIAARARMGGSEQDVSLGSLIPTTDMQACISEPALVKYAIARADRALLPRGLSSTPAIEKCIGEHVGAALRARSGQLAFTHNQLGPFIEGRVAQALNVCLPSR
jgi:hypothetical protein